MQILNLAVKVYLADPKKVILLFKYILDLCKYDQNYDLRDRARLIRCVFFQKKKKKGSQSDKYPIDPETQKALRTTMQEMFLSEKKIPETYSKFKDRDRFVMNTLSHLVMHSAGDNYVPLEAFPEVPPDNADKRTPVGSTSGWGLSPRDSKSTKKEGAGFFDDDSDIEEYTSSDDDSDKDGDSDSDTESDLSSTLSDSSSLTDDTDDDDDDDDSDLSDSDDLSDSEDTFSDSDSDSFIVQKEYKPKGSKADREKSAKSKDKSSKSKGSKQSKSNGASKRRNKKEDTESEEESESEERFVW